MLANAKMSFHPMWAIAEVVREIMKQNADDERALARCARVAHAFLDPALEVLWEEQEGLDRLFALLPSSIAKVRVGVDGEDEALGVRISCFVLKDTIRDKEWARMMHYARLVRVYIGESERIDGLCTTALLEKLAGQSLLPRLRRLTWKHPFDQSASLVLFLSPVLRRVHLDLLEGGVARFRHDQYIEPTAAEFAYGTALQMIHSRAPNVEHIEMWTSAFHCSLDRLVVFHKLRSLKLELVRNPELVLKLVSSLPQLKYLSVFFVGRSRQEPLPDQLPEVQLPTLRQLKLTGPPSVVVTVLGAVRAPVRSLKVAFMAFEDKWKQCMGLVASRFGASLQEFTADVEDAYDDPEAYSFHDWFSPLYAIRRLLKVSIGSNFETPFTVLAKDVDDMASAWPGIRYLAVPTVQEEPSAELPITVFELLARKCLRLRLLIFPVPHPAPLVGTANPDVSTQHRCLEEIRLLAGRWGPDVHDKCMGYLKTLFPNADVWIFDHEFDDFDG
ncbi:hypothetical protein BD414DRAFT_522301 [Trametes punicea]|nr:hypothetical protein BD414DRAFT_522301 [Trametes punicea]